MKPGPATRALLPIHDLVDHAMAVAATEHDFPCRIGCAHCCEQLVCIPAVEARAIAEHLVAPERASQLAATIERLRAAESLQNGLEAIAGASLDRQIALWWRARRACPLLDPAKKTCSVYPVRPLACRTYAIVGDPATCATRTGEPVMRVHLEAGQREVLVEKMVKAHGVAGVGLGYGPLPRMVLRELEALATKRKSA